MLTRHDDSLVSSIRRSTSRALFPQVDLKNEGLNQPKQESRQRATPSSYSVWSVSLNGPRLQERGGLLQASVQSYRLEFYAIFDLGAYLQHRIAK